MAGRTRDERQVQRAVLTLCAVIFLADVVAGILAPTFSLYAQGLGISVALLGAITTTGSLTQLLTALPIGILSDRLSRRRIVTAAMLVFAIGMLVLATAHGAPLLIAGRIVLALAMIGAFQIGAAYLGDITITGQREAAFGWLTTAMGLGYTVGPIIGSQIAARQGTRIAYVVAAGVAGVGFVAAWRFLAEPPAEHRGALPDRPARLLDGMKQVFTQRDLLVVSFGNLLMGMTFNGAISTFFPVYANSVGLTEATIGGMFAIRALVSAAGRFPNSMVARRYGSKPILLAALGLECVVMLGIALTRARLPLTLLLTGEGLAFGAYLVAGQAYLAERTTRAMRGAAIGVYSTASNCGGTVAPLALGLIAGRWGIARVFTATGGALGLGFLICACGMLLLKQRATIPHPIREATEHS